MQSAIDNLVLNYNLHQFVLFGKMIYLRLSDINIYFSR